MNEELKQSEIPDLPESSKVLQEAIRELEEKDKMKPKKDELAEKIKEIIESDPARNPNIINYKEGLSDKNNKQ